MTQSIQSVVRQLPIRSPVFKTISYIPLVGMGSSFLAKLALINEKKDIRQGEGREIEVIKAYKEYDKISLMRNALSIAMIVAAMGLGMLSGTVGVALVVAGLLFAANNGYQLIKHDQELQVLSAVNSAELEALGFESRETAMRALADVGTQVLMMVYKDRQQQQTQD